jgi:hypothetical protein
MNQLDIIPEIKRLCGLRKYDEAISLTNRIDIPEIAVKAHLLCVESEKSWLESKN